MVCWTWGRQGSPDLRPAPRLASRLAGLGVGLRPASRLASLTRFAGLGVGGGLRTSARPRGWQAHVMRLAGLGVGGGLRTSAGPGGWQASHALPDLGSAGVSGPPPGPEAGKACLDLDIVTTFIFRVQVQGLPSLNPCPSLPPSLPLLTVLVSTFSPLRFSFPPCSYSFLIHLFDSSCFHGHLHLISLTSFASTFLALPAFLSLFSLLTSAFQL